MVSSTIIQRYPDRILASHMYYIKGQARPLPPPHHRPASTIVCKHTAHPPLKRMVEGVGERWRGAGMKGWIVRPKGRRREGEGRMCLWM